MEFYLVLMHLRRVLFCKCGKHFYYFYNNVRVRGGGREGRKLNFAKIVFYLKYHLDTVADHLSW